MKITIVLDDGSRHRARLPYDNATHVLCKIACPHCKTKDPDGSIKISGTGIKHTTRDTYFADAIATCCMRKIGTIETSVETLFGIDEDERVLNGPSHTLGSLGAITKIELTPTPDGWVILYTYVNGGGWETAPNFDDAIEYMKAKIAVEGYRTTPPVIDLETPPLTRRP